jgi:hypothetical protein
VRCAIRTVIPVNRWRTGPRACIMVTGAPSHN